MKKIGILYIVATPIGNLGDISERAARVLSEVDLIAAEDTRHSHLLLQHLGITTRCLSLHEHNEKSRSHELLEKIQEGLTVALISDAGTPLISDPGYLLVKAAHAANIQVVPIPGACALVTALCASGLPSDRFVFEGFLPARASQRRERLQALQQESRTLIFYEAPHRIVSLLEDMTTILGPERQAALARELTKTFETIRYHRLGELSHWVSSNPQQQKGECVVVVQGAELKNNQEGADHAERILNVLLSELPVKQAVKLAAAITGHKKNQLYAKALRDSSAH